MPLFECSQCGAVDNSAVAPSFWSDHMHKKPARCTECETGTWHGMFPKEKAADRGYEKNAQGFLQPPGGWK